VKKIYLAPLGCAKNQIDGEIMLAGAAGEGHTIVADPDQADVLVVNTCAFIADARAESIDAILALARTKTDREGCRLVVTGCMAERYAAELREEIPEIDAMVGTGALDRFTDAIGASGGTVFKGAKHYLPSAMMDRIVSETDGSAYVKVSEGCDHECSFCVIPDIRGRHESRSVEDIAVEVERLVERGIVEINLVAQDMSAYGRDLGLAEGLAQLLRRLGHVAGLERVRCYYLYPNTLSDAALDAINDVENVVPYIDLPLQHADADVLRAMRRAKDAGQLERILDRVRERIADPVLRTSFIVGFPGETEAAFDRLCRFLELVHFDHISVFCYSREQGSAAAGLPDQVPASVAQMRRDVLVDLQEPIGAERLARFVGRTERILVCGQEPDGGWFGRTAGQGPEVDGVTYLGSDGHWRRAAMADVVITGAEAHDLFAEAAPPAASPGDRPEQAKPSC
jgi:ribosomal protein S12 methylthiotransferase